MISAEEVSKLPDEIPAKDELPTPPVEKLPPGASDVGESVDVTEKTEIVPNSEDTENMEEVGTECIVCGVPDPDDNYSVRRIYGPASVEKFDEYLTGVWAYSDGYTWSSTTTTNLSFSTGISSDIAGYIQASMGYTASVSRSYSVAIHLPADPDRANRLALYGDYNSDYLYYTKEDYFGNLVDSGYTYSYEPAGPQTLKVVYR